MKTIIIASDHPVTAHGLSTLIGSGIPGSETIEVGTCEIPAIMSGHWHRPCGLLIIVYGGPGKMAVKKWGRAAVPVLCITRRLGFKGALALYKAGARGVLDISSTTGVVIGAVGEVLGGQTFMERGFMEQASREHLFGAPSKNGQPGP